MCLADRRVRGRGARRETTGVPPTTGPPLGFPSGPPIALGSSYHLPPPGGGHAMGSSGPHFVVEAKYPGLSGGERPRLESSYGPGPTAPP